MKRKITFVLPCYNEKENIIKLIQAISEEIVNNDYEILVVDDNSPDRTYEAIMDLNHPFVNAILRKENRGLANSIRCGIENSQGDIIVVMDSDFNHQPKYLPFMIDNIRYYDCVSGSRFLYGGRMESRWRHYMSWLFNIFTRIMTGGFITDSLYGYFAIRRNVLFSVDFDKVFWGYGDYGIRLFYYLQKKNIHVLQFPAINGRRLSGRGNTGFFKVFWQYFVAVIKLTLKERF